MHPWSLLAFICLAAAGVLAAIGRAWPIVLVAAGLALELVPTVFSISN